MQINLDYTSAQKSTGLFSGLNSNSSNLTIRLPTTLKQNPVVPMAIVPTIQNTVQNEALIV